MCYNSSSRLGFPFQCLRRVISSHHKALVSLGIYMVKVGGGALVFPVLASGGPGPSHAARGPLHPHIISRSFRKRFRPRPLLFANPVILLSRVLLRRLSLLIKMSTDSTGGIPAKYYDEPFTLESMSNTVYGGLLAIGIFATLSVVLTSALLSFITWRMISVRITTRDSTRSAGKWGRAQQS